MLIAHCGDLHITDRIGENGATLEEQVETLLWIGEDAATRGVEAFLVAGDIFDRASGSTPAERNAAILVMRRWAATAEVVIVRGNHDRAGGLDYLGKLRSANPITVIDKPRTFDTGSVTIACLPWPRKAQLVEALGSLKTSEIQVAASAAMHAVLQGFAVQQDHLSQDTMPRILLGHVEIGAALTDSGQPLAGKADIELSVGDLLDTGADYCALGHIHKHQIFADGRICYAGSPRPTAFGQDGAKGYCLVNVERGKLPEIEHRRAPYRELVTLEWEHGEAVIPRITQVPCGSYVRLKYTAREDERAAAAETAAAAAADLHVMGCTVKMAPQIEAVTRVRSEEIRKARSSEDKLRAYWEANNGPPARAEIVSAKLADLEQEIAR